MAVAGPGTTPGPAGSQGPAGPAGPAGPQGAPGLSAVTTVVAESASDSANAKVVDVHCSAGERVVGGGAALIGAGGSLTIDENVPLSATS